MSLWNNYVCPKCRKPFPIFIRPSQMVRMGFFSIPAPKCQSCGAICRQKPSLPSAVWAWPLTTIIGAFIIYILRTTPFFISLHHSHPGIYGGIAGGVWGLVFAIGIRRGFRLVPLFDVAEVRPQKTQTAKWLVPFVLVILIVALALVTGRWLSCIIGIAIGLAVWGVYYSFFMAKSGKA